MPDSGLAADVVIGNIVKTKNQASAWYVLRPVPWSFRTRQDRMADIAAQTLQLARLTGHRCRIRVTSRPFLVGQWAKELDRDVRAHGGPMPGPCPDHQFRSEPGCPRCRPGHAWYDWLVDAQLRLEASAAGEKVAYLGVDLLPPGGWNQLFSALAPGRARAPVSDAELARLREAADEITQIVAGGGLRAVPASPRDMQWLLERSTHLLTPAPQVPQDGVPQAPAPYGLPAHAPEVMHQEDLWRFTHEYPWTAEPYDRAVGITGPDGTQQHVAVLAIANVVNQPMPPESPWLQRLDGLGFPTELVVTFDVLDKQQVKQVMGRKINYIREQDAMFHEHRQQPPLSLERQNSEARAIEDQAEHADPVRSTVVRVWARVAVCGDSEQQAVRRAAEVTEKLGAYITVHHPPAAQYHLAREFIPGEPLSTGGYGIPMMPARMLVAGMPAATTAVGDPYGFPIGVTSRLAARPVTWHPYRAIQHQDSSGLVTITGGLGSGKTNTAGLIAYMNVRAGIPAVIFDPSGLLDRMCRLPELRSHALAVNLLTSPPGTLCPYALITDPLLEDFAFDEHGQRRDPGEARRKWQEACDAAEAQRRALAADVLRMLLPADTVDKDRRDALDLAVFRAPARPTSSPRDVIDVLHNLTEHGLGRDAEMAAEHLEQMARHPWGRLFFPPAGAAGARSDVLASGRLLTVMTLKGLGLPSTDRDPKAWSQEERLRVPLLHLAAYLTRRHVLDRDRHARKLVIFDEAHAFTSDQIGRSLLNLLARDTRKNHVLAILISQKATDLVEAGLKGLIGASFTGRTDDPATQAAALELAGPAERVQGREPLIGGLSASSLQDPSAPKEFLFADGKGGMEVVAVDLGASPALREALDSRPNTPAAATEPPELAAAAAVEAGAS
jgi:hypothetical protein